jgi:hypothetical protein
LEFWKRVRDYPKKATATTQTEGDRGFYEQDAINVLIAQSGIKWSVLPDSFWCCHRRDEWVNTGIWQQTGRYYPEKVIFYHVTSCIDYTSKAFFARRALTGDFGPNPLYVKEGL